MLRPASIFYSLFFLFAAFAATGQQGIPDKIGGNTDRGPSLNAVKKKAEHGAERGDYSQAVHYYRLLWKRDSTDGDALNGLGEAALANTQYDTAVWAFQTLLNRGLTKDAGHTMVRLAYTYYSAGNYDEAERRYRQVETVTGVSKKSMEEAEAGLESCAWARGVTGEESVALGERTARLNTRYAEYSPVRVENTLYYTSYSRPLNRDSSKLRMQILAATPAGDSMRIQATDLNEENKHTAYLAFNENRTVQYFARADHEKESGLQFQLYRRKSTGPGAWGSVEKLPDYINLKDYVATQPNVGRLPGDTLETLFFVSDRPGSAGKKDIWYCHILKDSFSAPQNLKALNTAGDEVSPFYFSGDSTLYFSSTSHPQMNLGGFDIFRAKRKDNGWTPPAPMPPPFNSGANDVFYSVSEACNMQFFASNRGGNVNYSEEECCYNLYGTEKSLEIRIDVFHEITQAPLTETEMRLMEQTASGLTEVFKVPVPGYSYTFPLSANRKYVLITSKYGFNSSTIRFESKDDGWGVCMDSMVYLKPLKIDLDVYVFDLDTKKPIPNPDIYFYNVSGRNSDGSVVTGTGRHPLDTILRNNKDHFAHFELKPDNDYRVMATKVGFTDDSATASTLGFTRDTTLRRDLFIQQGLQYTVRVFDEFTREPLDFVSFTLKESGIDDSSNEKVYTHTSGAADNEYNRMIFYDRRYNISATKEGYLEDNSRRKGFRTDSLGLKKIPFQHIYDTLYLRRISLPILLYYDNDVPNKGKLAADTSTSWLYADTYLKYYYPKKNLWQGYYEQKALYLKECCSGMAKTDPRYIEMDTFFDNQVQREWNRLRAFREYLTDKLRSGECVKVNIAGFASPLGNAAYNKRLTRRRVDCLLNHLQKFEGETDIAEYYKQGRFIIEPDYNGSEDAVKAGVPGTGKASVYSVSAAKSRRVMIVSMEIFKCDQPLSGTLVPGSRK